MLPTACLQRFLLELGVKAPEEAHIGKLAPDVLSKVFLTLVKFNALLNGPNKDSVASKYSVWHTYHHLYKSIDGNKYLAKQQERRNKAGALTKSHSEPTQLQVRRHALPSA